MRNRKNREGSALVLAVIAFIILAGIGAAFFSFALAHSDKTSKASVSDSVLHIAEAGIDDAINKMSAYASKGSIPTGADWSALDDASKVTDGTSSTGFVHKITGTVNGGSYTVTISPHYDVTKKDTQVYRLISSASNPNKGKEVRGIDCYVDPNPVGNAFDYGLFGDVFLDAGGGIFTDSYKSSAGTYASQATNSITVGSKTYDYANTNGSVGSNGDVEIGGNSVILGDATPGPDGEFTSQGGGYVMGTTTNAENPVELEDQVYPQALADAASSLPAVVNGSKGAINTLTLGSNGSTTSYHASTFSFGQACKVIVRGNVTLYVDGAISMNSQDLFHIESGASVKIYHKSGDATINGQAILNATDKIPTNFQFYSSSTGKIKVNGTSEVYGVIYAPDAEYINNGGAPVYGAVVAKTINIIGDAKFHYDEDININPNPVINYKIKSWKEYRP